MKRYLLNRENLIFCLLYGWLSWINLVDKLNAAEATWNTGLLLHNHNLLLEFNYYNNEQSRLLQYYVPELFHRLLALPIEYSYMVQRWLFVWLALVAFHWYQRKWFNAQVSFCGVLLLAAIMPLTYTDDLQESSPLLLLTFLLGLWAIREHRKLLIASILLVGGINNETMLILPLVYLFYNYRMGDVKHLVLLCLDTLLISLPMIIAVGTIRYVTWDRPHLGGAWHLPDNLEGIFSWNLPYWGFLFIFGVLWIYACLRYREKPLFLKRASLMIPFFIAAHLLTGIIIEIRQMLPLSFILIPMALFYIYPHLLERHTKEV